jgi:hypothetical protein
MQLKRPFSLVHRLSYIGFMQWQRRICVWTELPTHHGCPQLWFQVLIFWQQGWSLLLGASALTSVQHTPVAWCCPCCYGHSIKGQRMCAHKRTIHISLREWHFATLTFSNAKLVAFSEFLCADYKNVPSSTICFVKLQSRLCVNETKAECFVVQYGLVCLILVGMF